MARRRRKGPRTFFIATAWIAAILIVAALISMRFFNTGRFLGFNWNAPATLPISTQNLLQSSPSVSNKTNSAPPLWSSQPATAKPDKTLQALNNMTIDEKIGQMVIGGYDDINEIIPVISDNHLGGVILFKNNIITVAQTSQDIRLLKKSNPASNIPLFISVDQEGGRVNRLPADMGTFESALGIGNRNDTKYAYNSGVKIGKALKQLGFNLDFAPDMDIFSNPENTVIADRAFGTTPDRVSKIGIQVLKGIRSQNIFTTAKHFPGHGDTTIDSHVGLPVVNKTLSELNNFEFKPFKEAISNNVDMIMVSHIELSKVDTVPSSLSHKVVTNILRNQLGYKGVIVTDDISMKAITQTYSLKEAAVKSVNAGCDIILVSGTQNTLTVIKSLKAAYESGQITEKQINDSVYRILKLKGVR